MTDPNDLLSYYAPVTTEALDATGAEGGADFFKLSPGPNYIRFLPRKVGESNTSPWVRRGQHWMRASKDAKAVGAAACMKVAHGDDADCPACAYAEALLAVPPTEPTYATCQAIAAEMKVKVSFIAAGIVYDAATLQRTGVESLDPSTAAKAIKLIEVGPGVRRELDDLRKNALAGGDFYDPRSGFIVCITKTGTGMNTSYAVQAAKQLAGYSGGSVDAAVAILKNLPSLDKVCPAPTAASVQAELEACRDKLSSGAGQAQGGNRHAGTAAAEMARGAGAQYRS